MKRGRESIQAARRDEEVQSRPERRRGFVDGGKRGRRERTKMVVGRFEGQLEEEWKRPSFKDRHGEANLQLNASEL